LSTANKATLEKSKPRNGAKKGHKPLNALAAAFEHEESKHLRQECAIWKKYGAKLQLTYKKLLCGLDHGQ